MRGTCPAAHIIWQRSHSVQFSSSLKALRLRNPAAASDGSSGVFGHATPTNIRRAVHAWQPHKQAGVGARGGKGGETEHSYTLQVSAKMQQEPCTHTCSSTEIPFPKDLRSVSSTFSSPPNSYSANLSACTSTKHLDST